MAVVKKKNGLDMHGLTGLGDVFWTPHTALLYEHIARNGEGLIAHDGPIVVDTSPHTGRSPADKFVVKEPASAESIWWGKVNRPMSEECFERLFQRVRAHLTGKSVYVQDCTVGADPRHEVPVRIITETAWHSLFARNLFRHIPDPAVRARHHPEFTVIHAPSCKAAPKTDGTNSEAFIVLNLARKLILIGGTSYAGEIKKSIFTVLNYIMPLRGVASMHCSANAGRDGDVAIFFGLSGTGKTSLSADPDRFLIGDDEHGWSDDGAFNYEGGCYAKVIRLSAESEPEIFGASTRFGAVLENVVLDSETRQLDLDDDRITENTRSAYPLQFIPNIVEGGRGRHPGHVIMLTCDAFGVMPPIARLSSEQAMYYFLSGYTAKVAGTEKGMGSEPAATFSTCFGAPFLVHHPCVYSDLLSKRINQNGSRCWLVNTGWTGGPVGVGSRIKIAHSRAMIAAALAGKLDSAEYRKDPVFGLDVPVACPDVPAEILNPRRTWRDPSAYDAKARALVGLFQENFKSFERDVPDAVRKAGPA